MVARASSISPSPSQSAGSVPHPLTGQFHSPGVALGTGATENAVGHAVDAEHAEHAAMETGEAMRDEGDEEAAPMEMDD